MRSRANPLLSASVPSGLHTPFGRADVFLCVPWFCASVLLGAQVSGNLHFEAKIACNDRLCLGIGRASRTLSGRCPGLSGGCPGSLTCPGSPCPDLVRTLSGPCPGWFRWPLYPNCFFAICPGHLVRGLSGVVRGLSGAVSAATTIQRSASATDFCFLASVAFKLGQNLTKTENMEKHVGELSGNGIFAVPAQR